MLSIKELSESEVWLELIQMWELIESEKAAEAPERCTALCRIVGAGRRTAKNNGQPTQ